MSSHRPENVASDRALAALPDGQHPDQAPGVPRGDQSPPSSSCASETVQDSLLSQMPVPALMASVQRMWRDVHKQVNMPSSQKRASRDKAWPGQRNCPAARSHFSRLIGHRRRHGSTTDISWHIVEEHRRAGLCTTQCTPDDTHSSPRLARNQEGGLADP